MLRVLKFDHKKKKNYYVANRTKLPLLNFVNSIKVQSKIISSKSVFLKKNVYHLLTNI